MSGPGVGFGAVERSAKGVDGLVGGVLEEVAVEVDGDRQGGVPKGLGDDGQGDIGGDHDAGGGVAQVVRAP